MAGWHALIHPLTSLRRLCVVPADGQGDGGILVDYGDFVDAVVLASPEPTLIQQHHDHNVVRYLGTPLALRSPSRSHLYAHELMERIPPHLHVPHACTHGCVGTARRTSALRL